MIRKKINDPRFKNVIKDKRFKRNIKKESKVKVDSRFKRMFEDPAFNSKAKVDKTGRIVDDNKNFLNEMYELDENAPVENKDSKNEQNDEEMGDEAQENANEIEVNDDEDGVNEDESIEDNYEGENEEEDEDDNEDDEDKIYVENLEGSKREEIEEQDTTQNQSITQSTTVELQSLTPYISLVNIRWSVVSAEHLMVICNSFIPPNGLIKSVTIYLSDTGKKMLENEAKRGPPIYTDGELDDDKVARYEKSKLKFYFAIIECNTIATAKAIYDNIERTTIEGMSDLEIQFVPLDVIPQLESREIKSKCTKMPKEQDKIAEQLFNNQHLLAAKNMGAFDVPDPKRAWLINRAFNSDQLHEADFSAFLASSDSEDSYASDIEAKKKKKAELYRKALLGDIENSEGSSDDEGNGEMEVTFSVGLEDRVKQLVADKLSNSDKTSFQKYKEKLVEEETEKDDDDLISGSEEEGGKKKNNKKSKGERRKIKKKAENQVKTVDPEMALLALDPTEKEEMKPKRTDQKNKVKNKDKKKADNTTKEDVQAILKDTRFSKLLEDPSFSRDPTSNFFKSDKIANKLILEEKQNRKNTKPENEKDESKDLRDAVSRLKEKLNNKKKI